MSCCNKKHTPDIGRGCCFCDCGEELSAHAAEGCYKLHETNWLEEYPDNIPTDIFEVRFKNTRRSYYQNVNNLDLKRGDIVAVEASPGHDIGIVSLTGDMVAKQMRRVGFNPHNGEFKKIYRKARPYDIEKWQEAIALEHETMIASRQIAAEMGLNMKIGDVEYQGDKIKAIFYYIADERVDFRELIKVFADRFRIRIEMKQIGARQEAGRIGGIGACGRELCCASWMSSFSSVTTNAARMQEISLNPQKLAGQCSKLKCCLMYEYDVYADARRTIPRLREPLQTLDGEYFLDVLAVGKGSVQVHNAGIVLADAQLLLRAAHAAGHKACQRAGRNGDIAQPGAHLGKGGLHAHTDIGRAAHHIHQLSLADIHLQQVQLLGIGMVFDALDLGNHHAVQIAALIEDLILHLGSGQRELMDQFIKIQAGKIHEVPDPVHGNKHTLFSPFLTAGRR